MNKQQDDIYTCPILEPVKIFELERYDQPPEQPQHAEYTIVQDHNHKISSSVWKYFGNLKKNNELVDPNHVYCSQCFEDRKTKKYQKSTSTGNLLKHLKKAHQICLDAPQFRIKREKDGIVVTKTEFLSGYDQVQYIDSSSTATYIPLTNSAHTESESEYLVHDIHEILIAEVAKRPAIYDASLCKKNKKQIRRELWNEIYMVLNKLVPLEKLPKIWKNIRDRYHKIKKDMERGVMLKPKYRYFHLLQFLDNVDQKQTFATENQSYVLDNNFESDDQEPNLGLDQPVLSCEQGNSKNFDDEMDKFKSGLYSSSPKKIKLCNDIDDEEMSEVAVTEVTVEQFVPIPSLPHIKVSTSPVSLPKSTLPDEQQQLQQQQQQQLQHQQSCADVSSALILSSPANSSAMFNKSLDEFDIFGNFVGQVMRNMSKSKARLLQMKVLQLITEFDD